VRRSCSRSRRGRDGKRPLEDDRVDREHVNVIETKFGRAVRRCEGGLDVADNEQFLPLLERTVSSAHRLLERHLLHGAVDHGVRYRWRIEYLLSNRAINEIFDCVETCTRPLCGR
jgi:hypothetical protein